MRLRQPKQATSRHEWQFDDRARFVSRDPPPPSDVVVHNSLTGASFNLWNLLNVLRADSPGAYSDDRFTQASNFVGTTYLAVHRLSEMAAASKVHVRIAHPDEPLGYVEAPIDDPLRQLMGYINEHDWVGEFLYQTVQQLSLTGQAPIWTVPNRRNLIAEMYCLRTATMWPLPTSPMYPRGAYRVQSIFPYGPWAMSSSPFSAAGAVIPAEQVVRIRNPHPLLYYDSYSCQTGTRLEADTINAINTARKYSATQGVDQSTLAIEFDPEVQNPNENDLKRMRAQLEAVMAGPTKHGKVLFLQPGSTAKPLSNKPNDMAYGEGYTQISSFLMAAWGVTKPVAGMIEETSYATLYAALKQFFLLTLGPLLRRISGAMTKRIARRYSLAHFIEIEPPNFDDDNLLEAQLQTSLACGLQTINEIRIRRKLPPIKAPWGEERAYSGWRPEPEALEGTVEGGTPEGADLGAEADSGAPTAAGQPPAVEAARPARVGIGSLGSRGGLPRRDGTHANGGIVPAVMQRRTRRIGQANAASLQQLAQQFLAQRKSLDGDELLLAGERNGHG